jgi:hypothetical protein
MGKDIIVRTHELALDTPRHRMARGLDVEVLGASQQALKNAEIDARVLSFIPYESDDEELIEAEVAKSEEILSAVGGLVIARSEHILELDRSVLTHIEQAAEIGVPVFMQTPLEEVAPAGWTVPPMELLVYAGLRTDVIKQRLEGEL